MFRKLLWLGVVVVNLSNWSSAGVISADHATFGVGALTRDTAQGLDFLDMRFSLGRTFLDVSGQFGAGGDFEGFRYATEDEVVTLINNYGFTPGAIPGLIVLGSGPGGELSGLFDLLDPTFDVSGIDYRGINGITSTSATSAGTYRAPLLIDWRPFYLGSPDYVHLGVDMYMHDWDSRWFIGSFIVASSPTVVPEPGSFTAFAGLLGIGLIVRRRKRHFPNL